MPGRVVGDDLGGRLGEHTGGSGTEPSQLDTVVLSRGNSERADKGKSKDEAGETVGHRSSEKRGYQQKWPRGSRYCASFMGTSGRVVSTMR